MYEVSFHALVRLSIMKSILIRVLACAVVTYWAWVTQGPEGLVYSSLVLSLAFARPIVDLAIDAYRSLRALAYRDIEGRQFSYRGTLIDVAEDDHRYRWLLLRDVRKVLPSLPRDDSIRRMLAQDVKTFGSESYPRIREDALFAYLDKATNLESVKFRSWVEKSVVYPSRRARERSMQ